MSLLQRQVVLKTLTPLLQIKRFRGKINIQRPRQPHYVRAKYLQFTQPFFEKKNATLLPVCRKSEESVKEEVDNPFQNIIARELRDLLGRSRLVGFFHMNPILEERHFKAYVAFKKSNMHYKNYGKKTVQIAVTGTKFETVLDFYCSRNMIVCSPEPDIKKMVSIAKKFPHLVLLAGIFEDKLLSKDEIMYYQQIPNLEAAQAEFVQTLSSVGSQIVSQLKTHPNTLVSQLNERSKQLEQNET